MCQFSFCVTDAAGTAPLAAVMGFTEEQMRACVLDGGTRFVAPGGKYSDERKAVMDEDVGRALPALGDAVEQLDLAGCELLTDVTVIEIVPRCPNLRVAMLGRVNLRRRARPLPLHRLMSPALSYRGSVDAGQTSKLTDPSIIALANACKSLVTLDLQYASSRADARARARARDARVAARAAPYSRRTRSALTRARRPPSLSADAFDSRARVARPLSFSLSSGTASC